MTPDTTSPRVLVVDDEESVRMFAERTLREGGYEVVSAADGPEALRVIGHQRRFDVFVLDVMMPQMRGDELARQIRLRDPDARVLYFTGFSDQLAKEKTTLWANEAFIEKPVAVNGLLEAVSLLRYGHPQGPEG